jgi:hypothetical protein
MIEPLQLDSVWFVSIGVPVGGVGDRCRRRADRVLRGGE